MREENHDSKEKTESVLYRTIRACRPQKAEKTGKRSRMVAIISVLIVQFRLLVGVAGTDVLKRLWNRRGRPQLKEGRKL